jgi:hypothetical protein
MLLNLRVGGTRKVKFYAPSHGVPGRLGKEIGMKVALRGVWVYFMALASQTPRVI